MGVKRHTQVAMVMDTVDRSMGRDMSIRVRVTAVTRMALEAMVMVMATAIKIYDFDIKLVNCDSSMTHALRLLLINYNISF